MAMGKRRRRARQKAMWVASADLPQSAGHPVEQWLNPVLDDASFDAFVETQCAQFYADGVGRPSLAPGRYFRRRLLGYFDRDFHFARRIRASIHQYPLRVPDFFVACCSGPKPVSSGRVRRGADEGTPGSGGIFPTPLPACSVP